MSAGDNETRPEAVADPKPDGGVPQTANAPGIGEGGRRPAQGYSVAAEAPQDSGNRTGRRNEGVGRDGAGASAEPIRNLGHQVSPKRASEASPAASREGAQMHAVEPRPATDTAHESATPAAGNEGTAVRGGPALPSGLVTKSGVTAGESTGILSRSGHATSIARAA